MRSAADRTLCFPTERHRWSLLFLTVFRAVRFQLTREVVPETDSKENETNRSPNNSKSPAPEVRFPWLKMTPEKSEILPKKYQNAPDRTAGPKTWKPLIRIVKKGTHTASPFPKVPTQKASTITPALVCAVFFHASQAPPQNREHILRWVRRGP